MAVLCMVYGQSGTGKSTSLRNFDPEEVAVINVSGKPLPFRGSMKTYKSDNYLKIMSAIQQTDRKSIVIDDATYLMVNEFMKSTAVGYDKFDKIGKNFNALLDMTAALPDDVVVYYIGHSEQEDDGRERFKTIGKMLDRYVTIEGKFPIVLKTVVQNGKYMFSTKNNGQDTVKSPMGMFESDLIDNDLKAVDTAIREYWGMSA